MERSGSGTKMNNREVLSLFTKRNGKIYVGSSLEDQKAIPLLLEHTEHLPSYYSMKERIEYLKTGQIQTCPVCADAVRFVNGKWQTYCSVKCRSSDSNLTSKRVQSIKASLQSTFSDSERRESIVSQRRSTMLKNHGVEHALQSSDVQKKVRETMLSKYGVEHALQSSDVQKKVRETMIERYDAKTTLESSILSQRVRETMLSKYGVEHALQSSILSNKSRQTMMERYGVEHALQSSEIMERVKETNQRLRGTEYIFQCEKFRDKSRQTMMERYGVDNPLKSQDVQQRNIRAWIEKYGYSNPSKSPLIIEKIKKTCLDRFSVPYHTQKHFVDIIDSLHSSEWWDQFEDFNSIRKELDERMSLSAIYDYVGRYRPDLIQKGGMISYPHSLIIDEVSRHVDEFDINTRRIISPWELDVYVPSKKFAIEVNGVYYHSSKQMMYHENKFRLCSEMGIKLIQFWDYEVLNSFDLVTSMIRSHLGVNERIYARDCSVSDMDAMTTYEWLSGNHIQGGLRKRSKCLVHKGDVVCCMVICNGVLERFASQRGITVVGGMSRLIKAFNTYPLKTYSDNRYSDGLVYQNLGFRLTSETKPKYYYTKDFLTLEPRWKFMKKYISHLGDIFTKTENQIMSEAGYTKIWGCGGKTWVLE